MNLADLHPDGIPYAGAPPEVIVWVQDGLARLVQYTSGARIELTDAGLRVVGIEPAVSEVGPEDATVRLPLVRDDDG